MLAIIIIIHLLNVTILVSLQISEVLDSRMANDVFKEFSDKKGIYLFTLTICSHSNQPRRAPNLISCLPQSTLRCPYVNVTLFLYKRYV
jgi:hypothetical protein